MKDLIVVAKREWRSLLVTALATSLVTVIFVFGIVGLTSGAQQNLAARVDRNAQVTVNATGAIICILKLGVGPGDPPRTTLNVDRCIQKSGVTINVPNPLP